MRPVTERNHQYAIRRIGKEDDVSSVGRGGEQRGMPADKEALAKRYSYSSITRNRSHPPKRHLAMLIHTTEYRSPDTNPRIIRLAIDKAHPSFGVLLCPPVSFLQ